MERGLSETFTDRTSPVKRHVDHMVSMGAEPDLIRPDLNSFTSDVIKFFAYAAREYMHKYPQLTFDDLVHIAYKNRQHGVNNPRASFKNASSIERLGDKKRMLCYPITQGMSAATGDGGAAAIVCNESFMLKHNLQHKAVEIVAQNMVTDLPSTFAKSFMDLSGYSMAKRAAELCYQDSGLSPKDVDVLEVHDCFSCNELFMYEALGLAKEGQGIDLFRDGSWKKNKNGGELYHMGQWVVNPSGGLESKGHPIGATGLIYIYLLWYNFK